MRRAGINVRVAWRFRSNTGTDVEGRSRVNTTVAGCESIVEQGNRAKGYWKDAKNRRSFLEQFAESRGIRSAEDWKAVTPAHLLEARGAGILKYHSTSVWRALVDLFPEKDFREEECCQRMPRGYWDERENQRKFLDEVAAEHGVERPEDWRRVTSKHLKAKRGGSALVGRFGSIFELLSSAYPELGLVEHECRPQVGSSYWDDAENRKRFMRRLKRERGISGPEGWKALGYNGIVAAGGRKLLERQPFVRLLQEAFPDEGLTPENCSPAVKTSHWDDDTSRAFFDRLAKELHIETAADWARVTPKDVRDRGGTGVLAKRNGSLWYALEKAYKGEFRGEKLSVFESRKKAPQEFWSNVDNVRTFLDIAKRSLGVETPQDWTRVSVSQIKGLRGSGLFRFWTLKDALQAAYPGVKWNDVSFCSYSDPTPKRSAQRMLHIHVKKIFPQGLAVSHEARIME